MIKIEIQDIPTLTASTAESVSQTLADAIATALVGSGDVDVGEDGVDMKITTTRTTEVEKDYRGEAG